MFLFLLQKTKTKVKEAGEKKRKRDKVTGFISFRFVYLRESMEQIKKGASRGQGDKPAKEKGHGGRGGT